MLIPTLTVTKRTKQFACIPIILCQRYNFAPKSRLAIICISLHSNLSLTQARAFCACIEQQSPVQSLILFQTNWILNLPLSNSLLFFFIFVHSHDLFSIPHPHVISSMREKKLHRFFLQVHWTTLIPLGELFNQNRYLNYLEFS